MPISSTAARARSSMRRMESGNPNSLFRLPSVFETGKASPNRAAVISLVVVLPLLPVTATADPPQCRRAALARRRSASARWVPGLRRLWASSITTNA